MATKLWVSEALQILAESLAPVPHELNELDWKAQLSDQKDRLAEHLMAFANHPNGGYLVFGVNDDGQATGVDQAQVASIVGQLSNLGRDAIEPPLALDHAVAETAAGVPLLLIRVPELPVKPAHRRGKSIEEAWVRSGGSTRKASRQEIGALLMNSSTPRWEDLRASPLLSLPDVQQLLDLEAIAQLLQRPLPEDTDDLARWLVQEGITAVDGRGHYITNFGAIAAARKLDDFPSLERKRIRVVRYRGTNKVDTIDEQPGQRGYAVAFEGLIGHLRRVLPHSEIIKQSLRTEASVYPEIALRELIANALIHQDFGITGAGPMVDIFDDRITITNPGALLPSKRPDRLIGTTPESRNERLASSFRRFRICEERGTGFQKVVQSIELFGLPPLQITPHENAFSVTLSAPRKFADMGSAERIEACYQHAVLQYLSSETLTNTTLRERFKLHEKQRNSITNLISDAVDAGRIKRKDAHSGNKFAEYIPYWA
ncbi:ATP-binding protein [Roseateles sp. DC23W]|uniref:ATP-binding protein n=1 Tax=Pelomonas dachongensis TaxID=3299029 RepID=A0ABW7EUX0_9BURK